MNVLDVETVRAFLVIAELKSFTRAAETLGTTQAALSIKLKRLENKLNTRLIERTPRKVCISSHGQLFIERAKKFLEAHDDAVASLTDPRSSLKLGVSCHVMGPEIKSLLSKLKALEPLLQIEIKMGTSPALIDDCNNGLLDVVITRSDDSQCDGTIICTEKFGWYATENFEYNAHEPLPLANLSPHCGMSNVATKMLDKFSVNWIEVFIGGGIPAVNAAISAGIGIGVFPCRLAPPELIEVGSKFNLPALPSASIIMHSLLSDKKTREYLHVIASIFKEEVSPEC